MFNRHALDEAKADNPDFDAATDIDLYDVHTENFNSRTVECKRELEREKKRRENRLKRNVVYFKLRSTDDKCSAQKSTMVYPNDLFVGPRNEAVKTCTDKVRSTSLWG